MPPVECSRCDTPVAASSLFCPQCGQSMLRPHVKDTPPADNTASADSTAGDQSAPGATTPATSQSVSDTKDTFTRAADWLRRLGKIKDDEPDMPRQSPTIGETVQAARQKADEAPLTGPETIALPIFDTDFAPDTEEKPRPSGRGQRRFVLKSADGRQFTLGEIPGGIGSQEDLPSPDGGPWQWVQVTGDESIDPVHVFFGSENGVLWFSDQATEFGTIVIEPGRDAIVCVPGQRYFVIRGSEIRLGASVFTLH